VLATATIGQVVAGPVNHAHAHRHFHAKKDAELEAHVEERQVWNGVDFATVPITYSSGQTWGEPTPAPAAAAVATTLATSVAAKTTTTASPSVASYSPAASSNTNTQELGTILTATDLKKLTSKGIKTAGVNAVSNNGGVWIGNDGAYTNKFINDSGEDLILVIWGSEGSWVNANTPLITCSLSPGESTTISFASGSIGAWSAVYQDTKLVDGQICNTWGEFSMGEYGVVDVSREVNMNGHTMEIVGPKCTTNMNTCVFVCPSGDVCTYGYELENCANGSQPGATYGLDNGCPSGGCGGMGSSASLTTTLS
jgi:hypothetical protein